MRYHASKNRGPDALDMSYDIINFTVKQNNDHILN